MAIHTKRYSSVTGRLTRRHFIGCGLASAASHTLGTDHASCAGDTVLPAEARHYDKLGNLSVQCRVCPRECVIRDGQRGACGTRENRGGTLYSLVYGKIASLNPDPIEKKPFFHVVPGSLALSIATAGCNMWCKFCQNHELSQAKPEDLRTMTVSPERLASEALRSNSPFIAYTYNEPTVFTEFAYDCSRAGLDQGVHSVVISNGWINPEPLDRLCEVITAYKVDLKSFSSFVLSRDNRR